jgi:1-deoxy-D-xylulose-5-phosphate reductoisomerase
MKKILLLGSTGSIGINTLNVVRAFQDKFQITGLTANDNIEELEKQINEFTPPIAVVRDKQKAKELQKRSKKTKIISGEEGLVEISKEGDYDILVSAIVGFAGLKPIIEAIKLNKKIALANKETLVVAGKLITELSLKHKTQIIPIDSEHSAIFQCLVGEEITNINKLILTASGGPFLDKNINELEKVTIEEALKHPNWKMGNKISIDSATMMNKGLEVIEAFWLFGLPKEKIEVIVHPQSVIHSMVEFIDGSIKAQLSTPDMKLPILYALSYPERFVYDPVVTDLKKIQTLTFFEPDFNKFPCLKLAYNVIDSGDLAPCILNAANEVAVELFLTGKIRFLDIPKLVEEALNLLLTDGIADLDAIVDCDFRTRAFLTKKFK